MTEQAEKKQKDGKNASAGSSVTKQAANSVARQLRAVPVIGSSPLQLAEAIATPGIKAPVIQYMKPEMKTAMKAIGYTAKELAEIEAWQSRMKLPDTGIEKLYNEGFLDDAMKKWTAKPKTKMTAEAMITALSEPAPVVKPVLGLLTELGISPIHAAMIETNESADKIRAFVAKITDDNEAESIAILMCVAAKQNTIAAVKALLGIDKFTADEKLALGVTHGAAPAANAIRATLTHEAVTGYVSNYINLNVAGINTPQYRQLVRFKSLLATGEELEKEKDDVNYVGNDGVEGKRTGFLKYVFNTETMYVHTHWQKAAKVIYSMHVKDGASEENGPEITNWNCFADVKAEVVAGQNRAGPTTEPLGESLT